MLEEEEISTAGHIHIYSKVPLNAHAKLRLTKDQD